jgi:hypothetical protein
VIIYILAVIFASIYSYTHILHGDIKDIDPEFELLTIIGIIFMCSFIHLLIYKFLFKSVSLNKFKSINTYEIDIDTTIKNKLKELSNENFNKFYSILEDPSKRSGELDIYFSKLVIELKSENNNNLLQYLIIYDIYMYFEENLFTSETKREEIKQYLVNIIENNDNSNTFISLLDSNEKKLIKLYHEELPFYSQISPENLEYYKPINTNISETITYINKMIIKYTGTFFPFMMTCIYIFGICIYNIICMYIIFIFIISNKSQIQLYPDLIYKIGERYISICKYIYDMIIK